MRCLLVYDISSDRLRAKMADACLDYGLSRIPLSALSGMRTRPRLILEDRFRTANRSVDAYARQYLCSARFWDGSGQAAVASGRRP